MKSEKIRLLVYTAFLVAIFIFSAFRALESKKSTPNTTTSSSIKSSYQKADLLKNYRYYSNLGEDISVKFFDQNNELVYEGEIKAGEKINDKKLLLLLLDSEFLENSSLVTKLKTFKN